MIFDYELMFIDDKNNTQKNLKAGVLVRHLTLSAKDRVKVSPRR